MLGKPAFNIYSGTYPVMNSNSAKALDGLNKGTANGTRIEPIGI